MTFAIHHPLVCKCLWVVEFATVGQNEEGKIYLRLWNAAEIDKFLEENELAEKKDVDAMQE